MNLINVYVAFSLDKVDTLTVHRAKEYLTELEEYLAETPMKRWEEKRVANDIKHVREFLNLSKDILEDQYLEMERAQEV